MEGLAHIAVFLHCRPDRSASTLAALQRCVLATESSITVYCDGARSDAELNDVRESQNIARSFANGFRRAKVIQYPNYRGRSRLIVDALTELFERCDRVIVIEDDIEVSGGFLKFMNDALERYDTAASVIAVSGYSYALGARQPYFLPGAHCWGWATWKRGWRLFEPRPEILIEQLVDEDLVYAFDGGGAEAMTQALHDTILSGRASWSLCWMATAIVHGKLTLFPGQALARNVDHCGADSDTAPVFHSRLSDDEIDVSDIEVSPDRRLVKELQTALLQWRSLVNPRVRLYALVMAVLPAQIRKWCYTRFVCRRLRNVSVAAGDDRGAYLGAEK